MTSLLPAILLHIYIYHFCPYIICLLWLIYFLHACLELFFKFQIGKFKNIPKESKVNRQKLILMWILKDIFKQGFSESPFHLMSVGIFLLYKSLEHIIQLTLCLEMLVIGNVHANSILLHSLNHLFSHIMCLTIQKM